LWDQQPFDTSTGYINQVLGYGGSSSYDTYQVHDVTVTGGGWNITSITEYFTSGFGNWPGSFNAKLNIFPLIGSLPQPADDPGSGLSPIYAAQDVGGTVTLSGLNINLAPGSYWIGFTPIVNFDSYGQEFQLAAASIVGKPSGIRNPGNGFGEGADWMTTAAFGTALDGAITINGDASIPEPGTVSLLGAGGLLLAGLLKRVRRA
jgi:hypothetical protein